MDYYTTSEYSPVQPRRAQPDYMQPMYEKPGMTSTPTQMPQVAQMSPMPPMNQPVQQVTQPQQIQQMAQPIQNIGEQYAPDYRFKYNPDTFRIDMRDFLKRVIKYLIEGIVVATVAYYFTKGKLDIKEIVLLGITAAAVFALLDVFSPTVAVATRFGAGFGVGQTMFGLAPGMMMPVVA